MRHIIFAGLCTVSLLVAGWATGAYAVGEEQAESGAVVENVNTNTPAVPGQDASAAEAVPAAEQTASAEQSGQSFEEQKTAAAKELADVGQKLAERKKAIEEQPAVVEAKKAAEAAAAAFLTLSTNSAEWVNLPKAVDETSDACGKAIENSKANDTEYPQLRKDLNEAKARRREAEEKLKGAASDAQEALKAEIAALDKLADEIETKKAERRKVLEAQPEVVAAFKAKADAETALQEFLKNNPDGAKVFTARKEAEDASSKALEDARASDTEYQALRAQRETLRALIHEIEGKIAAGTPAQAN